MRIASCMICCEGFEYASFGEAEHTMGGDVLGVCPTCRRRCEIGKRVEGMKPAENGFGIGGVSYAAGRNEALREARGEK